MKKLVKVLSVFVTLGDKLVSLGGKALDVADHVIHRKEYRRQKRVAAVFRTMLCVACGLLAVLFFPYKIKLEKNGDFEIRSLMLRIYRKTTAYQVPDGGEEFDILGAEDEQANCKVIGSGEQA